MIRAALYARYSSDNQSEASIEDQFQLCRDHAGRERWQVVGADEDAAISGSSMILRPDIQRLMHDAQHGAFNILLAEGAGPQPPRSGRCGNPLQAVQIRGRHHRHLGRRRNLRTACRCERHDERLVPERPCHEEPSRPARQGGEGKAGGGLCYGYRVVKTFDGNGEPIRGEREIIPEQAEVVRRIFREFASGKSPKAIAVDLNKDGIPGPLGRAWGDTSIRGHRSRGTSIINNELYAGVLVWNRMRFIKHPSTGKRVSRANPESEWIRTEVLHLRIVDDTLWKAVRARQEQIAEVFGPNPANTREGRMKRLHLANRPTSLLSGLLTCGHCGGKHGIVTTDRFGCLNQHRRGTCDNNRTITRDKIEARVLSGLKERLVSSEAVAEAVRAYAEEMNRLNRERRALADGDRKALAKVEKAIAGIIAAIEDGMYQPAMKARMDELERQKAEIKARLSQMPVDIPDVHPNIANAYRLRVTRFAEALDDPDGGRQAAEALRSLIGEVVLTAGKKRGGVHATLRGELMGILDFAQAEEGKQSDAPFTAAVGASPRNQLSR